jgi:hypothetical protein
MRLLLDQAFPASAVGSGDQSLEFERWNQGSISDVALIIHASQLGCVGVAFLGPSVVVRPDVAAAAAQYRILIVATSSDDPSDGQRDIAAHKKAIAGAVGTADALLVLSNGTRVIRWEEVRGGRY